MNREAELERRIAAGDHALASALRNSERLRDDIEELTRRVIELEAKNAILHGYYKDWCELHRMAPEEAVKVLTERRYSDRA